MLACHGFAVLFARRTGYGERKGYDNGHHYACHAAADVPAARLIYYLFGIVGSARRAAASALPGRICRAAGCVCAVVAAAVSLPRSALCTCRRLKRQGRRHSAGLRLALHGVLKFPHLPGRSPLLHALGPHKSLRREAALHKFAYGERPLLPVVCINKISHQLPSVLFFPYFLLHCSYFLNTLRASELYQL